jgi:hypothetical protein
MYKGTLAMVGPWEALVTFQQMIVLADKDGGVDMTADAISRETTIPLAIISKGIEALEKPDPESRTPAEEGRRIVRLAETRSWGWRIVNYEHYRRLKSEEERREYHRQYWHKRKAKSKDSTDTQHDSTNSIQAEALSIKHEAEEKKKDAASPLPPSLNIQAWEEWQAYRAERKLPKYRPTSVAKNSAFLASRSAEDQQAIVDYSIRNGYQGLFEAKVNGGGKPAKFVAPPDEEEAHA